MDRRWIMITSNAAFKEQLDSTPGKWGGESPDEFPCLARRLEWESAEGDMWEFIYCYVDDARLLVAMGGLN